MISSIADTIDKSIDHPSNHLFKEVILSVLGSLPPITTYTIGTDMVSSIRLEVNNKINSIFNYLGTGTYGS